MSLFSKKINLYKKPYKIIKEAGHGHRCYLEGLTNSEREVVSILAHSLDSKKYFIFNNLILPTEDGSTTQIDHLVISQYGIFVIESKDMNGWIFGNSKNKQWTQSLPGAKKYHFQNPIHQNFRHTESLITYLNALMDYTMVFSIITFSDRSQFKTNLPQNVIHQDNLGTYIKQFTNEVISKSVMVYIIGKISYLCQAFDVSTEQHIENINKKLSIK